MPTSTITVRIDSEEKAAAARVAEYYGFDLPSVTRAFYKQMIRENRIPLDLSVPESNGGASEFGRYTYRCVLTHESDGWIASFPQLGGCATSGDTREEAIREAHDLLTLLLCGLIEDGEELPEAGAVWEIVPVTVDITPEVIEETHYETWEACADLLDISMTTLDALVASGCLESKVFNGRRKVSIESMNRYQESERKAGRPKASATQG